VGLALEAITLQQQIAPASPDAKGRGGVWRRIDALFAMPFAVPEPEFPESQWGVAVSVVRPAKLAAVALAIGALGALSSCKQLDDRPNVGPCPVAGVLYDASRQVNILGAELHENVAFTGEIQKVRGFCRYVGKDPITMELEIDFALGKGPKAEGDERDYSYFVTVTRRDRFVLAKETFPLHVKFPKGVSVVNKREVVNGIVIPRANDTVSGSNFEVLVGFELTPTQLEYNRSGKRFRVNVTE